MGVAPYLREAFARRLEARYGIGTRGYIVRSELTKYHERMRPQHEAERAKRAEERFAAADLNKDGKLSRVDG